MISSLPGASAASHYVQDKQMLVHKRMQCFHYINSSDNYISYQLGPEGPTAETWNIFLKHNQKPPGGNPNMVKNWDRMSKLQEWQILQEAQLTEEEHETAAPSKALRPVPRL
jgi:hypothetical protein